MHFDNDELMLAAKVHELAKELRRSLIQRERSRLHRTGLDREELEEKLAEFASAHPVSEFVPDALKKIQAVAVQIRESRTQSA